MKLILPNCNQNKREIRFGETVVAKVGTASSNGWTDDAVAALIVKAVNEYSALVALAEAAKVAEKWFHASTEDPYGTCYRSTCRSGDIADFQIALANYDNIRRK